MKVSYVLGHDEPRPSASATTGCTGTIVTTRRRSREPAGDQRGVRRVLHRHAAGGRPAAHRLGAGRPDPHAVGQGPGGAAAVAAPPFSWSRSAVSRIRCRVRLTVASRETIARAASRLCSGSYLCLASACTALAAAAPAAAGPAPGAPGTKHTWAPADKHGFGTAHQPGGNAYFTLRQASLSEVYFPDLSTPGFRGLQFAVGDGKRFLDRETVDDDPAPRRARRARGERPCRAARRRPGLPPGRRRPRAGS